MTIEPTTDTSALLPRQPTPTKPTIAAPAGPPEPPPRRRAWLWASVRAVVVTLAVLGVVTLACPGLLGAWSARADGGLPSSIELPWPWQASVQGNPPGLAAVVATAAADPVEIVGRNGVYRALYPVAGEWRAGSDLHLSPDGRYLALAYLADPATAQQGPTIVDLITGRTRVVATTGLPSTLVVLGWRPDGGALLVATTVNRTARVGLLAVGTATLTSLAEVPAPPDPGQWRVAFSPDADRVAIAGGGSLHLVGVDGTPLWTAPLPEGAQLAGSGAFTPDGARIAIAHALPCAEACAGALDWIVTYVDSADGSVTSGPALPTIAGSRVRAVGWSPRADGTAALVVVRYLPQPRPPAVQGPDGVLTAPPIDPSLDDRTGPADLYELAPGAPARLLLDAPYEVTDLDVAADLVRAGRFQGKPSMPSLLPIEPGRLHAVDVVLILAVLGALAVVVAIVVKLTGRPLRRLIRRSWQAFRPRRRSGRSWGGDGTCR
jgi:hypothetical protein